MVKLLQSICFKIFKFLIPIEKIEAEIIKRRVDRLKLLCELGNSSILFPESKIVNRQNKKDKIRIGSNSVIRGELMIMGYGGDISIGDNSYIGENTKIWSAETIKIGNNVLVSHNVNIIDTNSHETDHLQRSMDFQNLLKKGPSKVKGSIEAESIIIEDYAWINFNSFISKGVRIGQGAIIAPFSLILEDVPPFTLYGGIPAKLIKNLKGQNEVLIVVQGDPFDPQLHFSTPASIHFSPAAPVIPPLLLIFIFIHRPGYFLISQVLSDLNINKKNTSSA